MPYHVKTTFIFTPCFSVIPNARFKVTGTFRRVQVRLGGYVSAGIGTSRRVLKSDTVSYLAEGTGIEPVRPSLDGGLASRCITTLPTFLGIPTGNRTPDNGLGNRCVTTTPSRSKLAEGGGVEPHPR